MLFIIFGIFLAAFGLKSFLLPNQFIDGGMTGISILLSLVSPVPISVWLIIVNLPFIIIAWRYISKRTAIYTAASIAGLAIVILFVEFPIITHDKLLSSIFGGMFLGAGIGMAIRGQSTLDGTEILALLLSKKTPFTVGNIITLLNVFIFTSAIFILGTETALYSILTYFSASKAVDFLLYGIEEFYAVTVISPLSKDIKQAIYEQMDRGVTIFHGEGGFKTEERRILYCVITKLETTKIKKIVQKIDPKAFVAYHILKDAHGGLTKKRFMGIG